jgi:hypothetical protein
MIFEKINNEDIKQCIKILKKVLSKQDKIKCELECTKDRVIGAVETSIDLLSQLENSNLHELTWLEVPYGLDYNIKNSLKLDFCNISYCLSGRDTSWLLKFIDDFNSFCKDKHMFELSVTIKSGRHYKNMFDLLREYSTDWKEGVYLKFLFNNQEKCEQIIDKFTEYIVNNLDCPSYFLSTRTQLVKIYKKIVKWSPFF